MQPVLTTMIARTKSAAAFFNARRGLIERLCLVALFTYFAARLAFYAFVINSFIPPDETTHVGIIHHFAKYALLPPDTPETWQYGPVTHLTYLYYYSMGKLDALWPFPAWDLVFLRLLNAMLTFGTVLIGWRLARAVARRVSWVPLLTVAAVTNTPMFSFLGASVNYDNLANLCAVLGLYYLVLVLQRGGPAAFLKGLVALLAGILTKVTIGPLIALYLLVLLVWFRAKNGPITFRVLRDAGKSLAAQSKPLLGVAGLLIFLNAQLYIDDLVKCGTVYPKCNQVLSFDQCLRCRTYTRDAIYENFRLGRLSYDQAVQAAGIIQHPGDRATTLGLLENLRNWNEHPWLLEDPITYVFHWCDIMLMRCFALTGHIVMPKTPFFVGCSMLFLVGSLCALVRKWRPLSENGVINGIIAVSGGYMAFLCATNYQYYRWYLNAYMGLQGRYCFPVLVPLWLLAWIFLSRLRLPYVKPLFALGIVAVLVAGDFPFFMIHAGAQWYAR